MNIETQFTEISLLITNAKHKAASQVNATLIELYWNIGQKVHKKVINNEWGKSIVVELAKFIKTTEPNIQGFSERNIWRMKQFYETYSNPEFLKLPPLVTELQNPAKLREKLNYQMVKLMEMLNVSFEKSHTLLNQLKQAVK